MPTSTMSIQSVKQESKPINIIKNMDTRCSRNCIKNWTNYNESPPKYQICECNKNIMFGINK